MAQDLHQIAVNFAEKWAKREGAGTSVDTHAYFLKSLLESVVRTAKVEERERIGKTLAKLAQP